MLITFKLIKYVFLVKQKSPATEIYKLYVNFMKSEVTQWFYFKINYQQNYEKFPLGQILQYFHKNVFEEMSALYN